MRSSRKKGASCSVGAVDVARAVLGAQAEARADLFGEPQLQPRLEFAGELTFERVRDGGDLCGVGGGVLALQRGGDERRERLVVERLMGILREQLRQLRADLLPEGEHRVALRLLRAELSAGLEHADLRLRVRTQLVRLAPRVGDDLFRLRLGVGKDLRGLAVRALDAVLFDGGYQILNLKLHKIRLSVFM